MTFDQFIPEFVEVPANAPPSIMVPIGVGEPCEIESQVWPSPGTIRIPDGDYTFNREGRLVPIDSPSAVSYLVPRGMRVVMSESDPEDDSLDDEMDEDEDIEFDDEDDDDTCEHGKGSDEHCDICDDEGDDEDDDDDLDDLDDLDEIDGDSIEMRP